MFFLSTSISGFPRSEESELPLAFLSLTFQHKNRLEIKLTLRLSEFRQNKYIRPRLTAELDVGFNKTWM